MSTLLDKYFSQATANERIKTLEQMRNQSEFLPIDLVDDLLQLRLSDHEKITLIHVISNQNNIAFEDFLTGNIHNWNQNVASAALWEWALRSQSILWHRTLPLSFDPHLSQRVSYTLLDLAWFGGGSQVVDNFSSWENLEDLSPAFLSLLYFRAAQWSIRSSRLIDIAKNHIKKSKIGSTLDRSAPYMLSYLYRFDFESVQDLKVDQSISGILTQFHGAVRDEILSQERIEKIGQITKQKTYTKAKEKKLISFWPMIWERHRLTVESILWIFNGLSQNKLPIVSESSWEFFAGIDTKTLLDCYRTAKKDEVFLTGIATTGNLVHLSQRENLLSLIKDRITNAKDPGGMLAKLPRRYSTLINSDPKGTSLFDRILLEQAQALNGQAPACFTSLGSELPRETKPDARSQFFDLAYRSKKRLKSDQSTTDDLWGHLIDAWQNPDAKKLEILSEKARRAPQLMQLCFIDTLGRFTGVDTAALKLLDYIRSKEEAVLRGVVYAFAGIATNRAFQELVAFLTRPNISFALKMEITQVLENKDLSLLQSELRSAINDLEYNVSTGDPIWELKEAISSLLTIGANLEESQDSKAEIDTPTTEDLDHKLIQKITDYNLLSGEVKRALRTAQFFHLQVEKSGNLKTIDLSPAIDMQYKALELSFREKFESATGQLIRAGVLQRKLDIIGYARPIPRAMDEFERYIESLPIIQTIPFFSRFKLRKMLRAICQFRPGKRFTLDGLKAFALFFACFSRKECRYGLANAFPLPKLSDKELFQFCHELHVFQDFRNRAAHEGFHPDASNDLDGIWQNTISIVQGMIMIEKIIEENGGGGVKKTG